MFIVFSYLTCDSAYMFMKLQHKIERNEMAFQFHAPHDDVYAVASLLKVNTSSIATDDVA